MENVCCLKNDTTVTAEIKLLCHKSSGKNSKLHYLGTQESFSLKLIQHETYEKGFSNVLITFFQNTRAKLFIIPVCVHVDKFLANQI